MTAARQVVIVTGAGSGIGAATAQLLAERGAHVIVTDQSLESAELVAGQIRTNGGAATVVQLDVSDKPSCEALFEQLEREGCMATGLVNNAGTTVRAPLVDLELGAWQKVIDTNLTGTMMMSQLFVRRLGEASRAIVNVTSVMAHFAAPNLSPYIASKGGVGMLTRALAIELATRNIRVNAVSPGYITTGMTERVFKVARFADAVIARTPMGRFGTPLEIARVIAFLLSDEASYLTGQLIAVDGGMTAGDTSLASPSRKEIEESEAGTAAV